MTYEPCPYCLADVRVTRWDQVAGLLVRCPQCGAASGPEWTSNRLVLVAFAGIFLNALVLFLVPRPGRALLLMFCYWIGLLSLFAAATTLQNDALFTITMCAVFSGPFIIAVFEFRRHFVTLRQEPFVETHAPAPPPPNAARFVGIAQLERLRNEVEIAIYHRKEAIALLEKLTYFAAGLQALLAALDGAWFDLSISLFLIGFAYTIRVHESRLFSAMYALFGIAVAAELLLHKSFEVPHVSLPVLIVFLEPAPHLQDS